MQLRDQGFWVGMAEGFCSEKKGYEYQWERDGKLAKQSLHQNYSARKRSYTWIFACVRHCRNVNFIGFYRWAKGY
jgi:hypothetical protein